MSPPVRPPPRRVRLTREGAIVRIRRQLEDDGFPRLQMSLIVALTGASGLTASFLMLHAGLLSMTWRYPLALLVAYGVFLLLLWAWLRTQASDWEAASNVADAADAVTGVVDDALADLPLGTGGGRLPLPTGGAGDFAGAGASGDFGAPGLAGPALDASPSSAADGIGDAVGDAAGGVFDADEVLIPLLVLLLAAVLALASLYVIWTAPGLLAELLFDGALSWRLFRYVRSQDSPNWITTALRRTALPFGLTGLFVMAVGAGLGALAPEAHTLGQALQAIGR